MKRWIHKNSDSIWIKLGCSCGGGDDCDIQVDVDMEYPDLTMTFYKEMSVWNPYQHPDEWYEYIFKYIHQIKNSVKVLFGCHIKYQSDFMFDGPEHIKNTFDVLTDAHSLVKASHDKILEEQRQSNLRALDEQKDRL